MSAQASRTEGVENQAIVLRQITDHIVQSVNRIRDDIGYIVFLRKNTKIQDVSLSFYVQQIDRFSRDVIITLDNLVRKDKNISGIFALILKIQDTKKRRKLEKIFQKIFQKAKIVTDHRNKIVAHYETKFNSGLGSYYPAQPFGYLYVLDPCRCSRLLSEIEKLFWKLKRELKIDGAGGMFFGGNRDNVFNKAILGTSQNGAKIELFHKCRYKDCLLK